MRIPGDRSPIGPTAARRSILAVAMSCLLAAAGCGSTHHQSAPASTPAAPSTTAASNPAATAGAGLSVAAFYQPRHPLPPGPPGTLIRRQLVSGVNGLPGGARLWRVLYHSTSIYGTDIAVSGYIVVPAAAPPAGGYPILSWAHGTTGIADTCAPSLFSSGGAGIYLVPALSSYLKAGFLVAATDYEGLGTPGIHPYLLGDSEGRGVLDAARVAARFPGVHASRTVIIYGHSQGGHAALFAGQLAPGYAPDLDVAGVVAAAPATNLSAIMAVAPTTTSAGVLSFQIMAAWSWANTYRDLPAGDLLTPAGQSLARSVAETGCSDAVAQSIGAGHLTGAQLFRSDMVANPVVVAHDRLNDPGLVRMAAPVLVVQGTEDTTVPPPLTDGFVTALACPVGDTIDYLHISGATHDTVPNLSVPQILSWITGRLQGKAAPTTCGRPGDMQLVTP